MEMTFPHFALRHDSAHRTETKAMLTALSARQANSQTVRVVRRADLTGQAKGGHAEQRISYFAHHGSLKVPVRGAFWRNSDQLPTSEQVVYQAGSKYIKVRDVEQNQPGDSSTPRGMEFRKSYD